MSEIDINFAGEIPARYDTYLGPAFFEPYAADLAARLSGKAARVLELACGSGIVTRRLRAALARKVKITATDLSEGMVAFAKARMPGAPNMEFRTADASALPFPDASFDAVVCQFGIMFVPDKSAAYREARRVLAPGGRLIFSTWDGFALNPVSRIAHDTVLSLFPDDPPTFLSIPFGYHDAEGIRRDVRDAGFTGVTVDRVTLEMKSPSARDIATGFATGTPLANALRDRPAIPPERVMDAIAFAIAREHGERPVVAPMQALVITATARTDA
jgi:SAM-dependent methyltransferase